MDNQVVLTVYDEYFIEPIVKRDHDDVLNFLKLTYYCDEPLNKCIDLCESEILNEYFWSYVADRCSFKAVTEHRVIVGVILNTILYQPDPTQPREMQGNLCSDLRYRRVLKFIDHINSIYSIFKIYPHAEKILECRVLAVRKEFYRMGVATDLLNRTIRFARARKVIPGVQILSTNNYLHVGLEKLGFEKVFEIHYNHYRVNGCRELFPELPHTSAIMMVMNIQ